MIKGDELENRQVGGSKSKRRDADDLAELCDRARQLKPEGADLQCAECWRRGRDAALRIIEAG